MMKNIAVISYDNEIKETLLTKIKKLGYNGKCFSSLKKALNIRLKLIFVYCPESKCLTSLYEDLYTSAKMDNPVPIVVILPSGDLAVMHRILEAGATDVLFCPIEEDEIEAEIYEVCSNKIAIEGKSREKFNDIIQNKLKGESPNFLRCLEEMIQASKCEANILLIGETGTGKEIFARSIHELSDRSGNMFSAFNCAALPSTLLESELFGHKKGAFTGADSDRIGRFEKVGAGTVLLDEIGDLKQDLQIKLLRVIEQREFQRVGENENREFYARIICATLIDLNEAVMNDQFRRDLLGRIDQFRIALPPLRERRIDIPILIRHFLQKRAKGRLVEVSRTAMEILESYDYPGNIRQLDNILIEALAKSLPGKRILPKHLPEEIVKPQKSTSKKSVHTIEFPTDLSYKDAHNYTKKAVDKYYLESLMRKHGNNLSRIAKEAGIDRKTLATRLKDLATFDRDKENV